ncbi:MAG: HAD family acid phosphatase [Acidobacteriaceae bacterium]|nr:HAD family acid phosphatase [Acidobacteriaceae bacterium]
MPSKWARGVRGAGLVAFAMVSGILSAQNPSVPTDHYGPPLTCSGVTPAHQRASMAEAEARAGEAQSWNGETKTLGSDEPLENFGVARMRLADYADCVGDSGCYWQDLDQQYSRAQQALSAAVKAATPGEKLAVVMDIDETALSSYCELKREDFGYIRSAFEHWIVSPEASVAIPGAKRFFEQARASGVAVFFLTGRSEAQREATERNLKAAGYEGFQALLLRTPEEKSMTAIEEKSAARKRLVEQGYTLAVSVGDQWSDLEGQPLAAASIKLPNPFYFIF